MICWWWVQDEAGREGKAVWSLQFETAISHNECLKSEKAAGAFSGIASKRLLAVFFFFSSSLSSHLVSFLPVWPLQVLCYLRANTGIHEPCTSTALWKRKPLCRSSWKAPSIVLCVPRWDEGSSWEKSGFCNQSHMLGKTASCRTRKIFVVNTSAWLSSGMPVCQRCFADWTPVQL